MIHSCKTHSRRWCVRCLLITIGFPVEHFIWERTPLIVVAHLLGLH